MIFSQLILEKIIMEVRYGPTYLFWDNSGRVLTRLTSKFPSFELRDAQISNVSLDWWNEGFAMSFNHLRADLVQDYPSGLDKFKEVSSTICELLREILEITKFARVGVRYIYALPAKSADEARQFFASLGTVAIKTDRLKQFGEGKIEEEQALIRYEGPDRGYTFRISHAPRDITLRVPRPLKVDAEKYAKNVLAFDVDSYSTKPLESSAFLPADFVRVTSKNIETSLLALFGQ